MFILTVAPWLPPPPPVHMILERDLARLYVRRWRRSCPWTAPLETVVAPQLHARPAHLADPECVGLVSSHDSAFVLHRQEHGAYAVSYVLTDDVPGRPRGEGAAAVVLAARDGARDVGV